MVLSKCPFPKFSSASYMPSQSEELPSSLNEMLDKNWSFCLLLSIILNTKTYMGIMDVSRMYLYLHPPSDIVLCFLLNRDNSRCLPVYYQFTQSENTARILGD